MPSRGFELGAGLRNPPAGSYVPVRASDTPSEHVKKKGSHRGPFYFFMLIISVMVDNKLADNAGSTYFDRYNSSKIITSLATVLPSLRFDSSLMAAPSLAVRVVSLTDTAPRNT